MKKEYCVYRMLGKQNNLLYIGSTTNRQARFSNHFSGKSGSNLTKEEYNKICRIEYTMVDNFADMIALEMFYMQLEKPPFNKQVKKYQKPSKFIQVNLEELLWVELLNPNKEKQKIEKTHSSVTELTNKFQLEKHTIRNMIHQNVIPKEYIKTWKLSENSSKEHVYISKRGENLIKKILIEKAVNGSKIKSIFSM